MSIKLIKTAQSTEHGKVAVLVETHEDNSSSHYTIREDGTSYVQEVDKDGFQIGDIYDFNEMSAHHRTRVMNVIDIVEGR